MTARRYGQPWTAEEDAKVLAAVGMAAIRAVAAEIGRTEYSITTRRTVLWRRAEGGGNRARYTEAENATLLRMFAASKSYQEMGDALGRTPRACQTQIVSLRQALRNPKPRHDENIDNEAPGSREPPPSVRAERDACFRRGHISQTAEVMGDPLPGRSALDRKLAASVQP